MRVNVVIPAIASILILGVVVGVSFDDAYADKSTTDLDFGLEAVSVPAGTNVLMTGTVTTVSPFEHGDFPVAVGMGKIQQGFNDDDSPASACPADKYEDISSATPVAGVFTEDFETDTLGGQTLVFRAHYTGSGGQHGTATFPGSDCIALEILVSNQVCSSDTDGDVDNDGTPVICKTVEITEHGIVNGVISVGESIEYTITIDVENNSEVTWIDTTVMDRFAGNLAVGDGSPGATFPIIQVDFIDFVLNLDCDDDSLTQKGKTAKEFLDCDFDDGDQDMEDGDTASVTVTAWTDFNPGQARKDLVDRTRTYTSCGPDQDVNSGATVSFTLADLSEHEFSTPSVTVDVFEEEDLSGDCDMDGFSDSIEIGAGTDPFDDEDFPNDD